LPIGLWEKISLEVFMSQRGCVRHINVGDPAIRRGGHSAQISLDPVAIAQSAFVGDGDDFDCPRSRAVGVWADGDLDDPPGSRLDPAVEVLRITKVLAMDGEQEVAG